MFCYFHVISCYISPFPLTILYFTNTALTFHSDYNFELVGHDKCQLIEGLPAPTGAEVCSEEGVFEYYPSSGYRRIPLTTCEGGSKQYDRVGSPVPCPNKQDEYNRAHAASGFAIFLSVVIPIAVASAAGWYVYRNWAGIGGRFGQIRLGEQPSSGSRGLSLDSDAPYIRYPVMAVAAVVAVVASLPLVASSLWRTAVNAVERRGWFGGGSYSALGGGARSWIPAGSRRFTTRDSFARGRAEYAIADEDEGELLGEDSDEEV